MTTVVLTAAIEGIGQSEELFPWPMSFNDLTFKCLGTLTARTVFVAHFTPTREDF
jgi:hypothetical protein